MSDILQKIVADKREEVEALKKEQSLSDLMAKAQAKTSPHPRGFCKALVKKEKISLIAELKKASPSKGLLRSDFHPAEIAKQYTLGGAQALSVLTEDRYFLGDRSYLDLVRLVTPLPLLRKDFIFDAIQIPESRLLGADAILLILAILTDEQLKEFLKLADELHLDVLCEVHEADEMKRALDAGARLIGINNRDLRTFKVDLQTTFDLAPLASKDTILVSESGIRCYADLEILRDAGIHSVLVGETLIRQSDLRQAIKQLYDPQAPAPMEQTGGQSFQDTP